MYSLLQHVSQEVPWAGAVSFQKGESVVTGSKGPFPWREAAPAVRRATGEACAARAPLCKRAAAGCYEEVCVSAGAWGQGRRVPSQAHTRAGRVRHRAGGGGWCAFSRPYYTREQSVRAYERQVLRSPGPMQGLSSDCGAPGPGWGDRKSVV